MEKIIFLDIDGVLATPEYLKDGQWALNPEKQKLLGEILAKTDAKIVLSSSWRYATLDKTKEHMEAEGFLFNDKLIGVTIRAYQWLERGTGIHLSIPRGVEIKQWIDTNIHSDNGKNWERKKLGKDFTYVIIDDESDMLLEHRNNFVHTKSEIGLTDGDVRSAVGILNKTRHLTDNNKRSSDMEKQIENILIKVDEGTMPVQQALSELLRLFNVSGSLLSDIRDEMDADMEDSGVAQGEIESCLNHWSNKYVIQRKEWFSNDR